MIEGKLEPLTAVAPTNDTLTEGDTYTTSVTGTLTSTGILSTATAAYGIEGVSGSGDITKTGTYGTLSLNTATGVYSYALDSSDTETAALSGGDVVNETFTVTVSDGLGGSASATLTIPIQGSGINLDAVTGDDLINLAEATAGLNLTGKTNPGQTISVVLSSGGTLKEQTPQLQGQMELSPSLSPLPMSLQWVRVVKHSLFQWITQKPII